MGEDPSIEAAKRILDYLIAHKPESFKGRDILQHKRPFKTMDEVKPGLKLLVERGYISEVEQDYAGVGRRESTTYEVN
ncbi:MAG: hypothetical protein GQ522_00290, partial [Deltaproteobacteria bacterium]|nr:hypothetical protein [Deltaproteobacteria bacterium]